MKITSTLFTLFFVSVFYFSSIAQYAPIEYTVRITATINAAPPTITLNWDTLGKLNWDTLPKAANSFQVFKKTKTSAAWSFLATLPITDTSYIDNKVIADSAYEYRVSTVGASPSADGYIYAGIKLHATDYRGKMLLVIDSTFIDSLSSEVTQLMEDISADGWAITSHYVSRNASPPHVKAYIRSQYMADSQNVKGLLLLGHVPVPYSGELNPDGHPEHLGAWPADVYYSDMHGAYTDSIITDTASNQTYRTERNVPGDGKFDQSILPGQSMLEMGRIDLDSMTYFAKTEKGLLQQYLKRDHDYRFKNFTTIQRGLISDNFYTYGEGFAADGWRNFAPMFGDTGTHTGGYFSTLDAQNYLWSYGCGGGNNEGAGGIGSTNPDFVNDTPKTVFTMLFGSYFGDWNHPNNFLRAPLASNGLTLNCAWGGRPMWFFHHMAMGETIGYGTMITQNNAYYYPYYPSYGARFINIALMGDPTLRQHVIIPPQSVSHTTPSNGYGTAISWGNSPDNVVGYYVYRSKERFGKYDRISPNILTTPPFVDNPPASGMYYYYVKAVKWEYSPSGSYLNTSEGIIDSVNEIVISGVADRNPGNENFMLYPNPASDNTLLVWQNVPAGQYTIFVKDELGRTVYNANATISSSYYSMSLSVNGYSAGCYYVEAINEINHFVQKLIVGK